MKELQAALDHRDGLGLFDETECLRIFYGPGESAHTSLKHFAVDLFKDQLWITQWEKVTESALRDLHHAVAALRFPHAHKIHGAVLMDRSKVASDSDSVAFWGKPAEGKFEAREHGARFWIQMLGTKHPGLFLDHAPLRCWLTRHQAGRRVLNLFSYTGSLSVAAALGGAKHVTTLDLSRTTIDWARENWTLNGLAEQNGDFIFGDVFEWLPKLAKRGEKFETILSDPPSFSRSKGGTFSTAKDLARLHALLFNVLAPGGVLVTSINSENISEAAFLREIEAGAKKAKASFQILKRVDLPESFPTRDSSLKDRYLKGFYLLRV